MTSALPLLAMAAVFWPALLLADLKAIRAEPKLEKRSEKALEYASARLNAARESYQKGETEHMEAALDEVRESVELSRDSLKATGKNPRKSFKHYKRAEIGTRQLLRRLGTFRDEMGYLDRDKVDPVIRTVHEVHEELLHAIMGGGK
jgi:hypothetical protein